MEYISDINNKLENSDAYETVVVDEENMGLNQEQIKGRGINLPKISSWYISKQRKKIWQCLFIKF